MPARKIMFTPEMDEALIEGTAQGMGYRPLSERIGVCREVIERRRKELGLQPAKRCGRPVGRIEWHPRSGSRTERMGR